MTTLKNWLVFDKGCQFSIEDDGTPEKPISMSTWAKTYKCVSETLKISCKYVHDIGN